MYPHLNATSCFGNKLQVHSCFLNKIASPDSVGIAMTLVIYLHTCYSTWNVGILHSHCEEQSDEAIGFRLSGGWLRSGIQKKGCPKRQPLSYDWLVISRNQQLSVHQLNSAVKLLSKHYCEHQDCIP
jgi:hypothetical protein